MGTIRDYSALAKDILAQVGGDQLGVVFLAAGFAGHGLGQFGVEVLEFSHDGGVVVHGGAP